MSSPKPNFACIDPRDLESVSGGARVSSRAGGDSSQLTLMLTQVMDSIKGLATQKPAMDPMMMMMMMQMGGRGGGGAGPAAAAAPPTPSPVPVINVSVKRGY